ncbi:MAG: glycosyltransferase family 4 protein [Candidatus Hydrogenedentes bacterium]|nr:glycosyltransferase family 4 protein [Candidatus Hydrogenedentota bacterium]
MRIVHVTSFFQPGLGYQENCLCPAQARLGHEVTVLTSDRYPSYPGGYTTMMQDAAGERVVGPGRDTIDGVELVRLPARWEWTAHNWVLLDKLWREIDALNPDVIHAHNLVTAPTFQVLWGNRRRRIPLVVDDHNNFFNLLPLSPAKRLVYAAVKHVLRPWLGRSVGRFLPMSHEVRRVLGEVWGVPQAMTILVFLGADPARFQRDEVAGRAQRRELGIPDDAVVVATTGKMTPAKDVHVLAEALGAAAKACPKAWLLLVGNAGAGYRRRVEAAIDHANLSGRVTWVGFAPNERLPRFYSAADIGVWPGDWSVTVLEAAACGLALVLPDEEYARYSVMNENGLLFKRGDAAALAQTLETLLSDEAQRTGMQRRSRELIETRLNWDAIARQTVQIYDQVAGARNKESDESTE